MKAGWLAFRTVLLALALASMAWGFRLMLFDHLPVVFQSDLEDLSYGWYVPLFSLYVLWRERREMAASVGEPTLAALPLLAVLLGFYFYHYFFLENSVQRWYVLAERMMGSLKGQEGGKRTERK